MARSAAATTWSTPLARSGGARSVNLTVTDGPLQPGLYRLMAHASGLLDRFGNPLDGNSNGVGGDDLVLHFTVAIPTGQVLESRSNDSIPAATPLPLFEDPAGGGFLTSSVALGAIDPAGDSDYWSFDAKAGDRLAFDMERTSGGNGQRVSSPTRPAGRSSTPPAAVTVGSAARPRRRLRRSRSRPTVPTTCGS